MQPASPCAAETVHLPGFADELCAGETYGFDLKIKSEIVTLAGERFRVGFADAKTIFDRVNPRREFDRRVNCGKSSVNRRERGVAML